MAAGCLLYRRCGGGARQADAGGLPARTADGQGHALTWGPWRVPGAWGIANNAFACVYLVIVWFFSFWPPTSTSITLATMNWSVLVTGAVMVLSIVYYLTWAKKEYEGSVVEMT